MIGRGRSFPVQPMGFVSSCLLGHRVVVEIKFLNPIRPQTIEKPVGDGTAIDFGPSHRAVMLSDIVRRLLAPVSQTLMAMGLHMLSKDRFPQSARA